jgi:hypothetical protein
LSEGGRLCRLLKAKALEFTLWTSIFYCSPVWAGLRRFYFELLFLSVRYDLSQLVNVPWMPKKCNLVSKISWFTQSRAFTKSQNNPPKCTQIGSIVSCRSTLHLMLKGKVLASAANWSLIFYSHTKSQSLNTAIGTQGMPLIFM